MDKIIVLIIFSCDGVSTVPQVHYYHDNSTICARFCYSSGERFGKISSEAFGRFFRPIEERQKQLEDETSKLQADVDLLEIDSFSRDQVMNDANYLQDAWPSLDQAEKRKLLNASRTKS